MALERSILTEDGIRALLQEEYDLQAGGIQRLKLGTANCYSVMVGETKYFLKEFQSGFRGEDLSREANLVNFLAEGGFPVARFLLNKEKTPFVVRQDHFIALEEYIEGFSYGYNDFPPRLLGQMAATLGKLHRAMQGAEVPLDMDKDWLNSFSAEATKKQYDAWLELLKQKPNDPHFDRIAEDFAAKKRLAERCEGYKKYFDGITYSATHGDFQGCQLICGEDTIKAVIDFSSARRLPVVWEVMRSFVQTSAVGRTRAEIDLPAFCDYVREYLRYFPLSRADLRAMPYVYLFQLARSKFGYKQYLTTDSEDREGLIQFAFWRTAVCLELEKRAEEISWALGRI